MLNKFDKNNLNLLRVEIEKAIAPIKEKYGVAIKLGGFKYDDFHFHSKMEVDIKNQASAAKDLEQYATMSTLLGFNKNIAGEVIAVNGKEFTVTKIDLGKPKFPIIATGDDGRSFKFTKDVRFKNPEIKREKEQWEK